LFVNIAKAFKYMIRPTRYLKAGVGFPLQLIQGLLAHQLIYFLQIIRDNSFCGLVAIPVFGLFANM
jgi:hypothetical protein